MRFFVNHVETYFRCFGHKVITIPSVPTKTQLNQVWNSSDECKMTILNLCLLLKRLLNYVQYLLLYLKRLLVYGEVVCN